MEWIFFYQLFLFDLDGLLVNTEELHHAAYVVMCKNRGYDLPWSFADFCRIAHKSATGPKEQVYASLPSLYEEEPSWQVLYAEKQAAYLTLLKNGKVQLLEGVEPLLLALEKANIKRSVVTNSKKEQVDIIREAIPLLNSIPYWFTRECYEKPKPDPEGYLKAIGVLKEEGDSVVGFEDSYRGYKALVDAGAKAVLVCPPDHPQLQEMDLSSVSHFPSFTSISEAPK